MLVRILVGCVLAAAAAASAQTVAVDVGHHLGAPGATSARGRAEFEFNRDLARDIAAALREAGLGVQMVGEDGGMHRLTMRTHAARGAALFLAVHHDSVQPHFLQPWEFDGQQRLYSDRYAGWSLFVSRKDGALPRSLACASAVGAQLRAAGFTHSPHHAERIPGEMKPYADRANGVHYYDNLVVLKTARQPALLIEAGVIVNRDEELLLADPARRARFARAVAAGAASCLPGHGRGARFDRTAESR